MFKSFSSKFLVLCWIWHCEICFAPFVSTCDIKLLETTLGGLEMQLWCYVKHVLLCWHYSYCNKKLSPEVPLAMSWNYQCLRAGNSGVCLTGQGVPRENTQLSKTPGLVRAYFFSPALAKGEKYGKKQATPFCSIPCSHVTPPSQPDTRPGKQPIWADNSALPLNACS